jgi:hypothetical protein
MHLIRWLAAFGLVALSVANARADRSDPVAAEALFRAGRAAADRGDYASACAKFEESNRLDPAVGTMFNLAACNEELGKMASAWQLFREAAQRFVPGDARIGIANARANALEPRLPRLTLAMASASPGAVVLRDGVELGSASLGLPLPVDPGDHVVVVTAPGRAERRYEVRLDLGQTRQMMIEPGAALPVAAPSADVAAAGAHPADRGAPSRTLGIVLLGAGGASVLASLALGAVALSAKQTVETECRDNRCSSAGLDAADRGNMAATISTVAFGVGMAGAAIGTYLLLAATPTHPASANATPLWALGVTPLPSGAFVSATGRLP